jgi:hypothetical protein
MSAWTGPGLPRLPDASRRVVSVPISANVTASTLILLDDLRGSVRLCRTKLGGRHR